MSKRHCVCLGIGLLACTGEVDTSVGVLEPVRVIEGSFHPGALVESSSGAPAITSIESASGLVLVGERDRLLSGRTSDDAYAIGLRFRELGSGWWTVPVQDLDPAYPGERDFQLRFDVGGGVPPGIHALALAALDEQGRRGELFELEVCVRDPLLPDDLNPCDPELLPPALVIALSWDLDVDLDLIVDTPAGKRISAKTPTSYPGEGMPVPDEALDDPTLGVLLRDSNPACEIDGRNAEAVVWAEPPSETGSYLVRADLFDACGQSGASLSAVVYRRVQRDDGTWALRETQRVDGAMFDIQASGGAGTPLYLMAVEGQT
ncbi:hypothetical protein ACNOYE_35560 [Nannocystaceae bacterium ST9]